MSKLPIGWDRAHSIAPPEEQLADAIAASGLAKGPIRIIMDGKIHRFPTPDDKGAGKSGWYVGYGDNVPAGTFGDWRTDEEHNWLADIGREILPEERLLFESRMAELAAARKAEKEKYVAQISASCAEIFSALAPASPDNPYLQRKKVGVHGIYQTGDGRLAVPVVLDGKIISAQYIEPDGKKQFHGGGVVAGGCFLIGKYPPEGPLYLAEGYATAASVYEAAGGTVAVAYSAHNLRPVAERFRSKLGPAQEIVIVGDNDKSGTGQKAAAEAGAAIGAKVVIPPEPGTDANDYAAAGGDLLALLHPQGPKWLAAADDFCAKPAPLKWLIKRWIQAEGLSMIFGDSGVGKTFVALDWVLSIAAGLPEWNGCRVKPGNVVYLAGEGHYGLRARIAGWKLAKKVSRLNMWISSSAKDLNAPEGLAAAISEIRELKQDKIDIIVVDTLHRFLNGDENKAVDAKTMLDACAALSDTFGAAVILVHHTGVSADAKGRARGSSAWRGALDNQFCVSTERDLIKIEQVKQKDSELMDPVYMRRVPVALPGWFDEDGEAVSTLVLEPSEEMPGEELIEADVPQLTKAQHFCLQAYREAADKYGKLDDKGHFLGVDEADWRNMFYKNYEGKTPHSVFARRKRELCDMEIIIPVEGHKDIYKMGAGYELEQVGIEQELVKNAGKDSD